MLIFLVSSCRLVKMFEIDLECIPCNLSIAIRSSRYATDDPRKQKEVLRRALARLNNLTWKENPMDISSDLQEIIKEVTGVDDPYREVKERSNENALKHVAKVRKMIEESANPLKTAAKIAAAGNLIDFGAYSKVDLDAPIKSAEKADFVIDDYEEFSRRVLEARRLLFFFDNAGEVIFDKLLIETMIKIREEPFEKMTFVGKEKPLLNDVTSEELRKLGFGDFPNSEIRGIGCGRSAKLHVRSEEVDRWFMEHDLVILKGQGNLEMFLERSNVFFLLVAKCAVVSRLLNVKQGSFILKYSR